jgi:hypothetical protein
LQAKIEVEKKSLPGSIYGRYERTSEPEFREWNTVMVEADEPGDGSGTKFTVWMNEAKVNGFVSEKGRGLGGIAFQAHDKDSVVVFKKLRWRRKDNKNQ